MAFFLVSLGAGMLTVLAPCILPLLPVVIGSGAAGRSRLSPFIVVGSLAGSVILFTFLLKVSTALVAVPQWAWTAFSGGVLVLFGATLVFPSLWANLPGMARLSARANRSVGKGYQKQSAWGDILIGVALGPVFSTCSPTYFVILASVLPASFWLGSLYLLAYVFGLSLVLLLLAVLGDRLSEKLAWLSNPDGWFKKFLGAVFILVGLLIATGYDKAIERGILEAGFFDATKVEQNLLSRTDAGAEASGRPYAEIADPSGFVNTDGITLGELVGKKVILVEFMTYSCINCQRTFPHTISWYQKYGDEGLAVIGIHTPEFAFEKDIDNVRKAMKDFGIEFPVVLDNDYATWKAYGNSYWPRKYLIDIHGTIAYDHIGEGGYDETEEEIRALLMERAAYLAEEPGPDTASGENADTGGPSSVARSPETYFGASRNDLLANGRAHAVGEQDFTLPAAGFPNALYLSGRFDVEPEYAEAKHAAAVRFFFDAAKVYMVASSATPQTITVFVDGVKAKELQVSDEKLYTLVEMESRSAHTLTLEVPEGVRLYTLTFG